MTRPPSHLFRAALLVIVLAGGLMVQFYHADGVDARDRRAPQVSADAAAVAADRLPHEARATLELIKSGGPFPYDKDGSVFSNREKALPRQPRGYYTEYTVRSPGSHDRGARRIIAGGDPRRGNEYYYTDDHYQSFKRILN